MNKLFFTHGYMYVRLAFRIDQQLAVLPPGVRITPAGSPAPRGTYYSSWQSFPPEYALLQLAVLPPEYVLLQLVVLPPEYVLLQLAVLPPGVRITPVSTCNQNNVLVVSVHVYSVASHVTRTAACQTDYAHVVNILFNK